MRILAIIPARGGSKGVPRKNIKLLNGKPLMEYTIASALRSWSIDDVFFSSDDQEMVELARDLGLTVPELRPAHLSGDGAGTLQVLQHVVNVLKEEGKEYDAVCLLQVTYPFRKDSDIDDALKKFENGRYDSLVSVKQVPHEFNPHWVFEASEDLLQISTGEREIIKRRQDLPPAYIRDGSIYITSAKTLMEGNSLYGDRIGFIESDPDRYVNIDTKSDWEQAEELAIKFFGSCVE
ncbi:MAG: acylneuraminate cytidylyltransferase family protein [Nonlabens sp.]